MIPSRYTFTIFQEGGSCFAMASGKLLYHQEQDAFELNGIVLRPAMRIEIHLMGFWMAGQLTKDATGWHVITSDHLDIGLRSGFVARFAHGPSSLRTPEQPPYPEFPKGEERKLILVVEDDEAHTSMLDQIFRQETPYGVYFASDGQLAWEILQDVKPNLIVLDYLLPGINGVELSDRIRADKALHDIPVLMISASLPSHEIEQRGIIGLHKPFEIDEFLHTTKDLIAST
jgi:CheY-like chemotaxis protein